MKLIDQKKIKVAEKIGWQWKPYGDMMAWYDPSNKMVWCRQVAGLNRGKTAEGLPPWDTSLDAVHGLEKVLDMQSPNHESKKRGMKFIKHLRYGPKYGWSGFADASERFEAVGLTLKLW